MNIFSIFRRPKVEIDSPVSDNSLEPVIEQMFEDGNVPPKAVPALAEMADIDVKTVEVEKLTHEEFRNRYRPRITPVAECLQVDLLDTINP